MTCVFDIETDGLLDQVTKIHVLSYTHDGENFHSLYDYGDMRNFLVEQKVLIGHNIIRYDIAVLERLLDVKITAKLYDTLPLAWYLDHDQTKHGLEFYGEKYGVPKPVITDWESLTRADYTHRCVEDVKINWRLWKDLTKRLLFIYKDKKEADRFLQYLTFKMKCAAHQEFAGIKVDLDLVHKSIDTLTALQAEKFEELKGVMPPRKLYKEVSPPKNMFKKDGTPSAHGEKWFNLMDELNLDRTHTEPVTVFHKEEPPNPNSSDQVKDWLFSLGWKPCTFDYKKNEDGTERTVPQVRDGGELSESVKLLIEDHPSVEVLDGLTVIQHRLAIFKSFAECQVDGYLRAEIAGLTNTLRFKHSKPLVNLPGVDRLWGKEIRGALIAPDGYTLCGADMVSLEDTTRRHYVKPYDPEYIAKQSEPGYDPHLDLAVKAGMCSEQEYEFFKLHKQEGNTLSPAHEKLIKDITAIRKKAKVVTYSATYGVGKAKLARSTGMSEEEAAKLIKAFWEINWAVKQFASEQKVRTIGGQMWVQNPVSKFWISLRWEKDIFSSLNQSTGVYCFDSWLAQCWVRGLKPVLQYHDEALWCILGGTEDQTKATMKEAIEAVNTKLQLNVPLDIDAKTGASYAGVH